MGQPRPPSAGLLQRCHETPAPRWAQRLAQVPATVAGVGPTLARCLSLEGVPAGVPCLRVKRLLSECHQDKTAILVGFFFFYLAFANGLFLFFSLLLLYFILFFWSESLLKKSVFYRSHFRENYGEVTLTFSDIFASSCKCSCYMGDLENVDKAKSIVHHYSAQT